MASEVGSATNCGRYPKEKGQFLVCVRVCECVDEFRFYLSILSMHFWLKVSVRVNLVPSVPGEGRKDRFFGKPRHKESLANVEEGNLLLPFFYASFSFC